MERTIEKIPDRQLSFESLLNIFNTAAFGKSPCGTYRLSETYRAVFQPGSRHSASAFI